MNNLTLKAKLIGLMMVAILALLVVGGIGWAGMANISSAMDEIGKNRLPSVEGLNAMNEGQTAVRSANRSAAFFENDYKAQAKFTEVIKSRDEAWKRIEAGWKLYEPLPQTKEEEQLWGQFVKEWDVWKSADAKVAETIHSLGSNTSEAQQKTLFAEFYQRSEVANPLFSVAETSLGKLVDLNVKYGDEAVKTAIEIESSSQ